MGRFQQHLRLAVRQLRRNPGFTFTVIVTLALSIGANTAIFSVVNALMLKSLPYPRPDRMGTVFTRVRGGEPYDGRHWIDGRQWEMLRDNAPSLIAAVSSGMASGVNLQSGHNVQYVQAGRVSAQYFDVLGIHPAFGRSFSPVEDRPHGPKAAILSNALWHLTFGANRNLIGQTINLKGEPYTVVGVLPAGATTPLNADVYTALQPSLEGEGSGSNFEVITRLRDGAAGQQADTQINRAWAFRIPATQLGPQFISLIHVWFQPSWMVRTARPVEGLTAQMQRALLSVAPGLPFSGFYRMNDLLAETLATQRVEVALLGAMAGLALLLSAVGIFALVANMVAQRTREIGIRIALGSSVRQAMAHIAGPGIRASALGLAAGIALCFLTLRVMRTVVYGVSV
jgi:putative ABC transport system permease protein